MLRFDKIGLAAILLLPSACVSGKSHEQVVGELKQAQTEARNLQDQNRSLRNETALQAREIELLRGRLEPLESQTRGQSGDIELLAQKNLKNLELSGELARLTRREKDLSETLEAKMQEVETRTREIDSLKARLDEREKEIQNLDAYREKALSAGRAEQDRAARLKSIHDGLAETLRPEIKNGWVDLDLAGDRVRVRLAEKLLFGSVQIEIKPDGFPVLKRVASVLADSPGIRAEVQGHTDNVPIGPGLSSRFKTNWELSALRASGIVRYLIDKTGLSAQMIHAAAYGDTKPIADNKTPQGRAENRRVEILILLTEPESPP
jgi:chemotaxis protein MotB